MALVRPFSHVPRDLAEWNRFLRDATVADDDITTPQIANNQVTDAKLRDSVGVSVIGREDNSTGDPADIAAAADDQFLVRRLNILGFGALVDADIPSTLARDAEVTLAVADEAIARDAAIAAKFTTGTFTGTLTGVAGSITGTLRYDLAGQVAVLYIPALSDTSTATTMTITGAPAAIFPTRAQVCTAIVTDNGTTQLGLVQVETSGVLTFSADVTGAVFTATGTKGVGLQTITYMRS